VIDRRPPALPVLPILDGDPDDGSTLGWAGPPERSEEASRTLAQNCNRTTTATAHFGPSRAHGNVCNKVDALGERLLNAGNARVRRITLR
jgi:hypothetical protein